MILGRLVLFRSELLEGSCHLRKYYLNSVFFVHNMAISKRSMGLFLQGFSCLENFEALFRPLNVDEFSLLLCSEFILNNLLYVKLFIVRNKSRESPVYIWEPRRCLYATILSPVALLPCYLRLPKLSQQRDWEFDLRIPSVLWCSWYLEQLNAVLNSGNVSELAKCSKGLRWIFYFGLDEIGDCSWQRFHQNPVESLPVTVFILLPFERILWHSAGLCLLKIILKFLNVEMVCDRKQKQLQYYSLDIMVSPRDLRCTEAGSAPRSQEAVKFRSLIFRKSITFKYSPEYLSIFSLRWPLLTGLWK